jgi:hypothetical protein
MRRQAMRKWNADYERRVQALELKIGPGSANELRAEIARERSRGMTAALRAVAVSFFLQRW